MLLLKLLFLPFKAIFGGSSSSDSMDDFLDDCDFFEGSGMYK